MYISSEIIQGCLLFDTMINVLYLCTYLHSSSHLPIVRIGETIPQKDYYTSVLCVLLHLWLLEWARRN